MNWNIFKRYPKICIDCKTKPAEKKAYRCKECFDKFMFRMADYLDDVHSRGYWSNGDKIE